MLSSLSSRSIRQGRHLLTRSNRRFYSENLQASSLVHKTPINYGLIIVPQQMAYVVERFGRFNEILEPGLHLRVPVMDKVAYVHSLKETAVPIPNQSAITGDNVTLSIDGVVYVRIVDPEKASYGVENAIYAIIQLAQTTMRSEIGKITLDEAFKEREALNYNIVDMIAKASSAWGIECLRYEIKDISPPHNIKHAMEMQAEAERRKRAEILESEGQRQADINIAEGKKQSIILEAEGEATSTKQKAEATQQAIDMVAQAMASSGGQNAVQLRVAEQYINAFGNLAKEGNTLVLPANTADPSSMIAQALTLYKGINGNTGSPTPPSTAPPTTNSLNASTNVGAFDELSQFEDDVDKGKYD